MSHHEEPVQSSVLMMALEVKQERLDLLETLKRIQNGPRTSRERALAITKIQEAIHWLGEELGNLRPMVESSPDVEQMARVAYIRYGKFTNNLNYRGEEMPTWDDLPEAQKGAWRAAINPAGDPYPTSYDPTDPHVEPPSDRKIG